MLIALAVIWSVRLPGSAWSKILTTSLFIQVQSGPLDGERRAGILGNFLQAGGSVLEVFLCQQKRCCTIYLLTDNFGLRTRPSETRTVRVRHCSTLALCLYTHTSAAPFALFLLFLRALPRGHFAGLGLAFCLSLGLGSACAHGGSGCYCTTLKCDLLELQMCQSPIRGSILGPSRSLSCPVYVIIIGQLVTIPGAF